MKRHTKPTRYIPSAPSIRRHFSDTIFPPDWATPYLDSLIDEDAPVSYGILMPGEHIPDGIPVIKVKDYVKGRLNLSSIMRTSPEIDAEFKRSRVKAGDILLSIRGGTGDVIEVPIELDGANITQDTARLRTNEQVSGNFLLHALRGEFVATQIQLDTIGQAVTGINIGSVRKLIIPLPPLPEQQKIADILGTWAKALAKLDALIAAKVRRKQALMQQLLSGHRRLPGFDQSKGRKIKNRHGDYPSDWSRVKLGDVTIESSVRADTTAGGIVLSCTKHHGLVPSEEYFGKRVYAADTSAYKVARRGEFAYATNHIEEGSIGYQNLCDVGLVSPIYTVFKTKDAVDDAYFYRLLKSSLMIHLYRVNTSASVDRRGSLRYGEFAEIKINLPKIPEQRAIAAVLDTADAELRLLRQQRTALDHQKRGLMQQLLTGRIRVNL